MIIGHGIDLVDLNRFRSFSDFRLQRLAKRICTELELIEYDNSKLKFQYLAKIWSCKEAVSKAFGTGIRDDVTWKNIQISTNNLGAPSVRFKNDIAGLVCHISISHESQYLIASAILEKT